MVGFLGLLVEWLWLQAVKKLKIFSWGLNRYGSYLGILSFSRSRHSALDISVASPKQAERQMP
jgi:hypothetical protein